MNMIESIPEHTHDTPWHSGHRDPDNTRQAHLDSIRSKLATYEREFLVLKEGTTMLELFLWKIKINESMSVNPSGGEERSSKKMKIGESEFRSQCRVGCGADSVIENVLPYLLPAAEEKNKGSVGNGGEGEESDDEEDFRVVMRRETPVTMMTLGKNSKG